MNSISHDSLFKKFLNNPSIAKEFLEIHIPENIKSLCNFKTLKLESGTFVEKGLNQQFSDMLYSLKISRHKGYIYCLIEHQSKPDALMPFRMLRYQLSIMKQHLDKGHKKLPIVLPILFYHGRVRPYPYSLEINDCFEEPVLAKSYMFKSLNLIDITAISDQEIKTHKSVALLEIVQKHIFERNILNLAYDIVYLTKANAISREMFKDVIEYIVKSGDEKHFEAFFNIITVELKEYKEEAVTIAERLMHKKALDIAKNMLNEGFDLKLIKKVTGLSSKDLNSLNKSQ